MKEKTKSYKRPQYLKRRLLSSLSMLLVAAILLTVTTYAWLVMSIAPEATGITTTIGANGSLEIALLNTETRQDLTAIRTGIGESLANRSTTANNTWGNLIDLSAVDYGLSNITLLPARLNVVEKAGGKGYVVDSGMLAVPTYGYDGRIVDLTDDTISAVYKNKEFSYVLGKQDYGVRAIGTADSLSVQGSALAMAKSNIATYTNSARSAAVASLSNNGNELFSILLLHVTDASTTYGDAELDTLKTMVADLQSSVDYIGLALRQGIVAVAASEIGDEDTFNQVRDRVIDTGVELSAIIDDLDEVGNLPEEYANWVTYLAEAQNDLNAAANACNALSGDNYTWSELSGALNYLMDLDYVFINDTLYPNFDKNSASSLIGSDVVLTLGPDSGIFASIADFTDDYSTMINAVGTSVEITTMTMVEETYLTALSAGVRNLEAADNSAEGGEQLVTLTSTYGYALDMAFRCNAVSSELLLQTTPEQRIYNDSVSASTMGGGSYMEFATEDSNFNLTQMILLMDAVRVGFVDDQGTLLGVAKLNTSNRSTADGVVQAPLYLYEYSFSEEDGSMLMGERQKTNNTITALEQNIAKAISVIVWLDGDLVDNTMVSATESTSLSGVLNLQFASSANLIPAENGDLLNISSDKSALQTAIETSTQTYEQGQGLYTTISWNAYTEAYIYATDVYDNAAATEAQIYSAALNLATATQNLERVSHDALGAKIAEIRTLMGKTDDLARIVVYDETVKAYVAVDPYTMEQYDGKVGEIYRVDYANNLHDEGNDVKTPIYTDDSWTALAATLYDAEAMNLYQNANDAQLDSAITALDDTYNALQRNVFYMPYEYNGSIYYFAISEETDTYGKWYDSEFKRVVSDRTILYLDAQAEPAEIAVIEQNAYVPDDSKMVTPFIAILDEVYPELKNEEIIAIQWDPSTLFVRAITPEQITKVTALQEQATTLNVDAALISQAEELLKTKDTATAAEAADVIWLLQTAVDAATPKIEPETDAFITAEQRILLSAAIQSAKSVADYENATNTELDALRTAVGDAETILTATSDVTAEQADNALMTLNTQLEKAGEEPITEYNTLTYQIPVGSEFYEIVYAVDYPSIPLYVSEETGSDTISALVLTRNGVIFTAKEAVTVYSRAGGVQISEQSLTIASGNTAELSAALICRVDEATKNEISHGETIKEYTWASGNTTVLNVSDMNSERCTITAVSVGTTEVTLSVETVQGNLYTTTISVTVTAP